MKRIILLNIIFTLWLQGVLAQETGKTMDLDACIEYALDNSQNILNSRLDVKAAYAEIGQIRASGLPQVNATLGMNYNFRIRKSLLPPETFGLPPGDDVELAFGTKYDGDFGVSGRQLIFDGSYFVGLQAAKMYKLYAEQEVIQTTVDLVDAVSKSYYMVLINEVRYERLASNEERVAQLLKETDAMYQSGFAEKIDVSRIQVNYNNIKAQRAQMKRLSELSKYMLKVQMGMSVEENITLSGDIESLPNEIMASSIDSTFELNNRIEFQLLETGRTLNELDLKNYKVQYLPNLYAIGGFGYNTQTNRSEQYFDFNDRWLNYGLVGVQLNIPLFDGLRKRYSIQKSKIEIEKIDNTKEQLENNLRTEIQQKKNQLANSLEMMSVQKENYELAEEIYNTTKAKFQEGVGSNLELVDANNSLIDAQAIYYDALYDAVVSQIELHKALGHFNDLAN